MDSFSKAKTRRKEKANYHQVTGEIAAFAHRHVSFVTGNLLKITKAGKGPNAKDGYVSMSLGLQVTVTLVGDVIGHFCCCHHGTGRYEGWCLEPSGHQSMYKLLFSDKSGYGRQESVLARSENTGEGGGESGPAAEPRMLSWISMGKRW